ncbi:MAG: lysophospholipid acyltransferase family protein [Candidatus Dormibacteria bacterium]
MPPLPLRLGFTAVATGLQALGSHRYRISDPIANATFALQPGRRRTTIRNFRAVLPNLGHREARRLAARSYREYARTALDFLYVHKLPRGRVLAELRTSGVEANVIAPQLQGKSGLLVVIHHGSWDVPGAAALAYGVNLVSVMTEENGPTISELVIWARAAIGVRVVPASKAPAALLRQLGRGGWAALVADIPGDTPSVEVEFLGHRTRFSAAPGIFAARTGVPLVPATSVRRPNGGYLIEVHPPVPIEPGTDPAEALRRIIPVFEAAVRRWPEQWYPFREDQLLDLDHT